jgi:tetratricopeptide (TPR) repeat protein
MTQKQSFYSLPQFHQAGLHYFSDLRVVINSSLSEKIKFFKQKKSEGYESFKNCDYPGALEKYHQCLVIFRWIENRNPNWSSRQINDSDLAFRAHPVSDEVKSCLITAYLNIAICSLKLEQWKEAELACDEVLKIDDKNVKALYRKAQAISSPVTAGPEEYKQSIRFLNLALSLDPKNVEVKMRLSEVRQISSDGNEERKGNKGSHRPFTSSIHELNEMIAKWEVMVNEMSEDDAELSVLQKNLEKIKKYKNQLENSLSGLSDRELTKFKTTKFGIDITDFLTFQRIKEVQEQGSEVLRSKPLGTRETWEGWFMILLLFSLFMSIVSFNIEKTGIFN